jgi:hypothetical protein
MHMRRSRRTNVCRLGALAIEALRALLGQGQ